jgi:hypothetical protein
MYKLATPFAAQFMDEPREAKKVTPGYLMINAADEIIYANKQARHFLGLMADEALPAGQKFLSLVQSAYQCYPSFAWLDWPQRPSSTTIRYLIFSSSRNASFSLLKVEVVEHLVVDGGEIWAVAIDLVESSSETAVIRFTHC